MCGILGTTHTDQEALKDAASCIAYRGPDHTGYFMDDAVAIAHHRLSIIDTDARANQPMVDPSTGVTIAYNGELYNFEEVRRSLSSPRAYLSASDTEVILHAYLECGMAFLPRLRGMFAFAIYDPRNKTVVLARDHAGIKPLYYTVRNDALYFGSEVKAVAKLLQASGDTVRIDRDAVELSLVYGYVPPPLSLVSGVTSVPPSTYLVWDIDGKRMSAPSAWSPQVPSEGLEDALQRAVREHLVSDVPVGIFLSGGIDSSLLLLALSKQNARLKAYTLVQEGKEADAESAKEVAAALKTPAPEEVLLTPEAFDEAYRTVMERIDEPLSDTSIFPTTLLALRARKDVKVILSGEGGDELFFGYNRQRVVSGMRALDGSVTWLDRIFLLLPRFPGKNRLFLALFTLCRQPVSYYLLLLSPGYGAPSSRAWKESKRMAALRARRPVDLDAGLYLEGDLLRKLDLATSYASIEGRVPLLDVGMYKAARSLDPREAFSEGGVGKRPLLDLLAHELPRSLFARRKSGFGMRLAPFEKTSEPLHEDVAKGIELVRRLGISLPSRDARTLIVRFPRLALLLATLARAYDNTDISHEAA